MESKEKDIHKKTIPIFESQIGILGDILKRDIKIGMILVNTSPLLDCKILYDKNFHNSVKMTVFNCLCSLKGIQIRKDDIITINITGGYKYYIFLSKSREKKIFQIKDYDDIVQRIQDKIYNTLFSTIYPITKIIPKIRVGYSICFYNPLISIESLLQDLIEKAESISVYQDIKTKMSKMETLYKIIKEEEINTFYQPVLNLKSKESIGYESFVKGPSNTIFYNPLSLFANAKDLGLQFELDWLCKKKAIENAKGLRPDKKLFIKIMSTSIHDNMLRVDHLKEMIKKIDVLEKDIVFEIRDEDAFQNVNFINRIIKMYSCMKFAIAIKNTWEDKNISFLKAKNISYIKLDKFFIRDLDKNSIHHELLKKIMKFAGQIHADVIAEGIHNQKELDTLVALGVNMGQGYFFAKPQPGFIEVQTIEEYVQDEKLHHNLLASIYYKRGKDYFEKGIYDKAILEFTKVLEVDTKNLESLYYRGYSYCEENGIAAASQDLNEVLKIDPYFSDALLLKAFIYEKQGKINEALENYQRYIETASKSVDSQVELAVQRIKKIEEK